MPSSNETSVRPVHADNQAPPPSKVIPSPVQALRPSNSPFTTVETSPVQPITSARTLSPAVLTSSMQPTTVVQSFPETTTSQLLPRTSTATGLAADVVMSDTVVHGTPATVKPLPVQQNTPNHSSPATVDSQVQNSVPAHFQRQQIPSSTTDSAPHYPLPQHTTQELSLSDTAQTFRSALTIADQFLIEGACTSQVSDHSDGVDWYGMPPDDEDVLVLDTGHISAADLSKKIKELMDENRNLKDEVRQLRQNLSSACPHPGKSITFTLAKVD